MSEVKTLNFTIGEDLGLRIMEIAQEHLLYNFNPKKAVETITGSLIGCPTDLALQILLGEMVLPVNMETQEVICVPREKDIHDHFPQLNISEWYKRKHWEIGHNGGIIYANLQVLMNRMAKNQGQHEVYFDYKSIIDFAGGNVDPILQELKFDDTIREIKDMIRITKNYLDTTQKVWAVMDWMKLTYPKIFDMWDWNSEEIHKIKEVKDHITTERHEIVGAIQVELTHFLNVNYKMFEEKQEKELDDLDKYINTTKEIDDVLSNGIKPVNILDGYNAGWLSPLGTYYGLNGEIANMLHNQMADAMYEAGIIPEGEENEQNPYGWLEENGWVKLHDNWILYGGYEYDNNVPITPLQQEIITKYGQTCHKGILKVGLHQHAMSAAMFGMIDEVQLKMKWFKF